MPLQAWICDECGDSIVDPDGGLLVWQAGKDLRKYDFRIVHKGPRCDFDRTMSSMTLSDMLGPDGQAWLLSFLTYGPLKGGKSRGVVDMDAYVDVFRRLQTPWYEEARRNFTSAAVIDGYSDANEVAPYTQLDLEAIANVEDQ